MLFTTVYFRTYTSNQGEKTFGVVLKSGEKLDKTVKKDVLSYS
jgi:hypothetical protein